MSNVVDVEQFESIFHEFNTTVADCDYEPMLKDFQQVIAAGESAAFAGEQTPGGEQWAPLSPYTIQRKGHDRILVETGALRESLVQVGGPGNINATADHGLLFGTEVEYAHWHMTGTRRMPARPEVGMSSETVDDLCERVADVTIAEMRGE